MDVWNQGMAFFDSRVARDFCGAGCVGPNMLSWALYAGNLTGIEVLAWFEYGLMAAYSELPLPDFCLEAERQGWISGNASGFIWLDPRTPALDFLINLMSEASINYPQLAGVQLDDHFAWPASLPGDNKPAVMTAAAQKLVQAVRSSRMDLVVSLSPNPVNTSIDIYSVDWIQWFKLNLFDEYIPQLYTSNTTVFTSALDATLFDLPSPARAFLAPGIR